VAGEQNYRRIRVHLIEEPPDRPVERDIDILHRIPTPRRFKLSVLGFVQVPELMPGTMAVCKDCQEEIPIAFRQKVLDELDLAVDPCDQLIAQLPVLLRPAVRGLA
jgi:hypothetical protein